MGIKHSRPVPPFMRYCSAIIPTMFDDSLSYYEALCALNRFIQTNIVEVINNNASVTQEYIHLVDELKEYVEHYFDNLDVQEEINNKLDAMAEDGSLQSIIGEYINDGFLNDNFYVYPIRKGRLVSKTNLNPDFSNSDFVGMQGGCYVGNNHLIQAKLHTASVGSDEVELSEINTDTGEIIRSATANLQHANSITYDPNTSRLYITSLTYNNANTQLIYVLDYTTFNLIKTIDLSSVLQENDGTHSISYDEKTGKFVLCTELRFVNSLRFFYIDVDTEELEEIEMTDKYGLLSSGANNDITVYDNHLYLLKHVPSCVSEWDLNTGKLIKNYNIPVITPEGFTQGEPEHITYSATEKVFYLGTYNPDCQNGHIAFLSYYTFDLIHGNVLQKSYTSLTDITKTIYVDSDSTVWNPKGTRLTNAFVSIGEALEVLNLPEITGVYIFLKEGKTYNYARISSEKTVVISTYDTSLANAHVQGIDIVDSNKVLLTALEIEGVGDRTDDLNVDHSTCEITSVKFGGNFEHHINLWHSNATVYNLTLMDGVSGVMFNSRAENVLTTLDRTPNYDVKTTVPALNKPIYCTKIENVNNTFKTANMVNFNILKNSRFLMLNVYGDYNLQSFRLLSQSTDGGNRNFSVVLNNVVLSVQIVFDYTNNQLKAKITKAINLGTTTPTDVTSSFNISYIEVYVAQ